MNEVVLKKIMADIEKNRLQSSIYSAKKNNELANKFEHIAVGLEQAYRIIANEMAVA
jgi:hypothetical protein